MKKIVVSIDKGRQLLAFKMPTAAFSIFKVFSVSFNLLCHMKVRGIMINMV